MSSPQSGNCNGGEMTGDEALSRGDEENEDNRFSGGGGQCEEKGMKEPGSLVDYEDDSGEEGADTQESRKRGRNHSGAESDASKSEDNSTLLLPENSAKRAKLDASVSSPDCEKEDPEIKAVKLSPSLDDNVLSATTEINKAKQHGDHVEMEDDLPQPSAKDSDPKHIVEHVDQNGININQGENGIKIDGEGEEADEEELENEKGDLDCEDVKDEAEEERLDDTEKIEDGIHEENFQMTNQEKMEESVKGDKNNDKSPENENSSGDSSDSDIDNSNTKKIMSMFSNECLDDNEAEESEGESSDDSFFDLAKKEPQVPANEENEGASETGEEYDNPMSNEQDFDEDDREDENKNDSDENCEEDVVDIDLEDDVDADVYGEEVEEDEDASQSREYSSYASQQVQTATSSLAKSKEKKLYVMKWVPCEDGDQQSGESQYLDLNDVNEMAKVLPQIIAKMPKEFLRNLPNLLREVDPKAKEYLDEAYRQPSLSGYGGMGGYPPPHRFPGHGGLLPMYAQQPSLAFPGYSGLSLSHQMQQQEYFEQQQRLLLQQQQQATARPPPPRSPPPPQVKKYCEYPPPDTNEGVAKVTVAPVDYQCLKKDQFLNDVIIDFFLKYLQYGKFPADVRDNIHIFSTYFYDTLTKKRGGEMRESDPEKAAFKRYDRVKRWTRKVNLFEKDFVVVPINENYHWYVCIICYPGLDGCVDMETGEPCQRPKKQVKRSKKKDRKIRLATVKSIRSEESQNKDRDEAEGDEIDMEDEDDKYEKRKRRRKIERDNEMDRSYGYSENGEEYVDENMYSEHMEEDYGWNYEQEGDNEVVDEEEADDEDVDHGEDIFDSSDGVIVSSEGDAVTEIVEDESRIENQSSSLDEIELDTGKTPEEYHGDNEIETGEYPLDDEEEDFDESDEEKVEPKMEDEEEEMVEIRKEINVNIVKQKQNENLNNDSDLGLQKADVVQITTDIIESINDSEDDVTNMDSSQIGKEIVDDQEIAADSLLNEDSIKSVDGENEEGLTKKLDNGELKDINGVNDNINGEIEETEGIDKNVEMEKCDVGERKEKERSIESNIAQVDGSIDLKDESEANTTEPKETEEQVEEPSNVSKIEEDEINLEQNKDLAETSSRNDDEPIITLKMVGNNEPDSEIVKLELETQLPVTENSGLDNKEVSSDTEEDASKEGEVTDKGDVLIDESTETLEEQEVVVDIKPEVSLENSDDILEEKDTTKVKHEVQDTKKEGCKSLNKDSNVEIKYDKVADLKSMWSDPEDEDLESEKKVSNNDESINLNKNEQGKKMDMQGETTKELLTDEDIESEILVDKNSLGEEILDEDKLEDETMEQFDDDMGDVTIEQMDEGENEDVAMESDEDEVILKTPAEFKMPILPPGMTINRQRDPVLDDFETGIENLQHNMENEFENRSSDEELSEEELEEESIDDVDRQNGLPPSVFERLLQNRETGSNEDSDSRTRHEESEYEESEIESSEDEEEEEEDLRPVKQPCILVFDSLGGTKFRKSKVCNTIREYLNCEFKTKVQEGNDKFTKEYMPASSPKVQQQPNFSDCGIYLLQFVESFFTQPISDFSLPITSIKEWFPEEGEQGVKNKRANIANLIRDLTKQQNPGKDIRFPNLVFGSAAAAPPAPAASSAPRQDQPDDDWNSDGERYSDDGSAEDDGDPYSSEPQYSRQYQDLRPHQMFGVGAAESGRMPGMPPVQSTRIPGMASMPGLPGIMAGHHQHQKINLPPGVSITRKVETALDDTEELESSDDDDIIVDEGEGHTSSKKLDEWVEYIDEFGRTRRCLKSEMESSKIPKKPEQHHQLYDEDLYMDQSLDRSRDDWENNYDEDTEDYMYESNPSSPLEIIEETYDGEKNENSMDTISSPLSPFISMVSHCVGRFSPFVSMVSHQPVNQTVLAGTRHKSAYCVTMLAHQITREQLSPPHAINEDATTIDLIDEIQASTEDREKVADMEKEFEMEESMEVSDNLEEPKHSLFPISNSESVDEPQIDKVCTKMSPETTTHIQHDDFASSSSGTKAPVVPLDDSDVEMGEDETSAELINDIDSTKDTSHSLVDDPPKTLNDVNVEKVQDLCEDIESSADIDSKEDSLEILNEKIGQVDGSIDLKDEEDMEQSADVEESEELVEQVSSNVEGIETLQDYDQVLITPVQSVDIIEEEEHIDSKEGEHEDSVDKGSYQPSVPCEAKHVTDIKCIVSDILDNIDISTQIAEHVPDLHVDSSGNFDEDIDDETSDGSDDVEDDTLDTPIISEFTSKPFFKPSQLNEAVAKSQLFGEKYSLPHSQPTVQQYPQPSHLQSLLHRETGAVSAPYQAAPSALAGPRQPLSVFGTLPGLSMTSSRHIPTFETAFNEHARQPNKAPKLTEVTLLTDSEDEDDDEPGDVFIKGNRLYQRRGKKQGRVAKYLCRDEKGVVSVRNQLPLVLPTQVDRGFPNYWPHQTRIKEIKSYSAEKLFQTLSHTSVEIKSSDLANEEILEDHTDAFDSHDEVIDSDEDQNEEVYPDPSYPSEDSRSKISEIRGLGEDSVDNQLSENLDKPQTNSVAQTMKDFLDDDDW